MLAQPQLLKMAINDKDIVYTPPHVAMRIVEYMKPSDILLDPCAGDGSFLNSFPSHAESLWCEIEKGIDFLLFGECVDWIIGNPPYSTKIFLAFLHHAFELAENVVFLLPVNKVFQSWKVMDAVEKYGGIRSIIIFGSGTLIGFPFGFSVGAFRFQKNYQGDTRIDYERFYAK